MFKTALRWFRKRFFGGSKALSSIGGTDVPAPALSAAPALKEIPWPSLRQGPTGPSFVVDRELYPEAFDILSQCTRDNPTASFSDILEIVKGRGYMLVYNSVGPEDVFDTILLSIRSQIEQIDRGSFHRASWDTRTGVLLSGESAAYLVELAKRSGNAAVPEVTPVSELLKALKEVVGLLEKEYGVDKSGFLCFAGYEKFGVWHEWANFLITKYSKITMAKYYFSCSQIHRHELCGGLVWDKDNLLEVTAEDSDSAVNLVIKYFGFEWANRYSDAEGHMVFFPGGIVPWESWAADYARWWDMRGLKEGDMAFRWSSSFDGGDEGWMGFKVNQTYLDLIKEDPKSYRVSIPDDFSHYNSPTTL